MISIYRASKANRILWTAVGTLLSIASLYGVLYFASGQEVQTTGGIFFLMLSCLSFAGLGVYLALYVSAFELILKSESIELQTLGSK